MRETGKLSPNEKEAAEEEEGKAGKAGGGVVTQWGGGAYLEGLPHLISHSADLRQDVTNEKGL